MSFKKGNGHNILENTPTRGEGIEIAGEQQVGIVGMFAFFVVLSKLQTAP